MRSEDEAGLQRSIEHMEQMSDEELRKTLNLYRSKLEENKSDRELLKAKMINNRRGYRGYSSDRINLVNLSHQIDYQTLLVDAQQRILESRQTQAAAVIIQNASIHNTTIHNTAINRTTNYNTAVQWNVINDARGTAQGKNQTSDKALFDPSDDYRSGTFLGEPFTASKKQARVLKQLHERYKAGHPWVTHEQVLQNLENTEVGKVHSTSRVKDLFKRSPLWKRLVLPGTGDKEGFLRLNLPDPK